MVVWPELAKIRHFGKFLTVHFLFGKMISLLWRFLYIIELIFIVTNGQILKNNLTIWSHCLVVTSMARWSIENYAFIENFLEFETKFGNKFKRVLIWKSGDRFFQIYRKNSILMKFFFSGLGWRIEKSLPNFILPLTKKEREKKDLNLESFLIMW